MKIIADSVTLLSVIYAALCSAFLRADLPPQYFRTAYLSTAFMLCLLILRIVYIISKNTNKKPQINDILLYLMYYLTIIFELNVKFGYGDTVGISGADEKIGLLYTLGLSYTTCNILNIFIFALTWGLLILKMNYSKIKFTPLFIILGAFIAIKSTIVIITHSNNNYPYSHIAAAHLIFWVVYLISKLVNKIKSTSATA